MYAGKLITLTLTLLVLLPVTACNTVGGFGEDLEGLGKSLQSSAEDKPAKTSHEKPQKDTTEPGKSPQPRFNKWQQPK